jgi:tetratricopeptide (TPR) repeat protein
MARTILTVSLIVLLNVLVGCSGIDSGRAQLMPTHMNKSAVLIKVASAAETDIVEQLEINRQAYQEGLKMLIDYYSKTGNNMKLAWASKELSAFEEMPRYSYLIEASIAGPDLKAKSRITEADELYYDALMLEEKAKKLVVIKDNELLRVVLNKYNQLIKKYPTSDKIDDAAYRAAGIYEYFKDYTIAVLYYQRAYQWDIETVYPAKYKAAYLSDKKLHRRDEALELYKQLLDEGNLDESREEFVRERVLILTKGEE